MAKGGARPGAGRKKVNRPPPVGDKCAAAKIIDALNKPQSRDEPYEIQKFRAIENAGIRESLDLRKWLYDKRDGKPVQTVNHVHDKPIDINVTMNLSETIQKARKRAVGE